MLALFGGMALLLYGIQLTGEGLQRAAGGQLRTLLTGLTRNRLTAVLSGALVTAIIQSSSATTVMLIGFVSAGLIPFAHTLGVILAFARKLHLARDAQNRCEWAAPALWGDPPPFGELADTTLGLVGFGAIGHAIANRARALGMKVLAVRRHPASPPDPAHAQWTTDRLPDLIERSDWLVLAAPLTAETRGLIGRAELARCRPGAVLVNLGRGALVDEDALVEALREHRIAGAALDVFREEPLPASSPLWTMPHVILTPHVSGFGPRYWERALEIFGRNLRAFLDGRPLENVVDKRAGY